MAQCTTKRIMHGLLLDKVYYFYNKKTTGVSWRFDNAKSPRIIRRTLCLICKMTNKIIKIFLIFVSIIAGIILLSQSIQTMYSYIVYPDMLRLIHIPFSRLIIQMNFGLFFLIGGTMLLFSNKYYKHYLFQA